jgi:glycosyltransferase involved in cell wall biosynthesis
MQNTIYINGRFLTVALNGIRRTAYELVYALDELIERGGVDSNRYKFIILYSGEIKNQIVLKHIQIIRRGILKGNLWEQFELPIYSFGSLLVSMCTISTLFKRKQVIIVHDASVFVNPQYFSSAFRAWYKFAVPLLGKLARHIITVSEFSKNELVKYAGFDDAKITVIYNAGEHIKRFGEPDDTFIAKIEQFKPYCLAVSSLAVNKNFNGLGKALNKITDLHHHMLIAGSKLTVLQENGQEDNMIYLGYVSNEELQYLYRNASLFIFPSFYEGFGIPPLEAMALGCPVIASDTTAMPEILGNASAYFNPYDATDMSVKIDLLLKNNDELTKLKNAGYRQSQAFNWTDSALRMYNILTSYSERK